jgi:pterin-4a-carbinolamine dehydratase
MGRQLLVLSIWYLASVTGIAMSAKIAKIAGICGLHPQQCVGDNAIRVDLRTKRFPRL